jgi:PAS domain S-box-containing protein
METSGNKTDSSELRKKAEKILNKKRQEKQTQLSESEALNLIQELNVYQIELELQNQELVLANNASREAKKKYVDLYDFAPSGFYTLSCEGDILNLNFNGAKLLGRDRSILINCKFAYFISNETKEIFNTFLKNVFSSNVKESCEVEFISNATLPVNVYMTGIITDNKEECFVTAVDITERKKSEIELSKAKDKAQASELYLKNIINNIADPVFVKDDLSRLLVVNKAFCKLFGITEKEAIGKTLAENVSPEERELFLKIDKQVLFDGKENINEESLTIDGSPTKIITTKKTRFIGEKGQKYLVGIIRNITEQKKFESELIVAKKRAEESDQLKSAFLANMSHEIRTPMNGILGFSELLKEPNLRNDDQLKYIGIIEKSGARMLNIINDIIDVSKIQAGQMTVILSDVDINKSIEDCYNFFKPEAAKKNLELGHAVALKRHDAIIKTDRVKLSGVLVNLVKNAIKYTNSGSIDFGYKLNSSKNELEFYVKDTGVGIPDNRQIAIFERFIQVDIEDKMAKQGAGLGLAIAKAYVEMLNGRIWVESKVGRGSAFYFTLPYKPVKLTQSENIKKNGAKQSKQLKVLIVEDDEASCQFLKKITEEYARDIITVETGKGAIDICRSNPDIDLILMDVQISGGNGYQTTKIIREFNKEVIIIAQTAFALTGDREKSIEAGCNDYISKPIKKQILLKLIQSHFSK